MSLVVLLNSGSTINEGRLAKGGDKFTEAYKMECAVCSINPADFEVLGRPNRVRVAEVDGRPEGGSPSQRGQFVPPGQSSCRH